MIAFSSTTTSLSSIRGMSYYDPFKLVACCGGSGDTLWEVASLFFSALPSRSIALEFMVYDKDRKARTSPAVRRAGIGASIYSLSSSRPASPGPHPLLPARNPSSPAGAQPRLHVQ